MTLELVEQARNDCTSAVASLNTYLAEQQEPVNIVPFTDRTSEMPTNPNPDHPDMAVRQWHWWRLRSLAKITGITIHHTLSHSPVALAKWITMPCSEGGKGYPTTQYAFWVSAGDGCPVWKLADLSWAIWHDHTGPLPRTISVGMAGALHVNSPPVEQMIATAKLCVYLADRFGFWIEQVQGHDERAWNASRVKTVCPGWHAAKWFDEFHSILKAEFDAW